MNRRAFFSFLAAAPAASLVPAKAGAVTMKPCTVPWPAAPKVMFRTTNELSKEQIKWLARAIAEVCDLDPSLRPRCRD